MIILKGVVFVLGGFIALFSAYRGKLPQDALEWLIWALDAYIIIKEVVL